MYTHTQIYYKIKSCALIGTHHILVGIPTGDDGWGPKYVGGVKKLYLRRSRVDVARQHPHTTYAAALKTTTHPKTRCRKPYAATQHLMLLWWWAYVPETCRAKNTSIKLSCCIKLAIHFISWGRCTVKQPSNCALCLLSVVNRKWDVCTSLDIRPQITKANHSTRQAKLLFLF